LFNLCIELLLIVLENLTTFIQGFVDDDVATAGEINRLVGF